jgi:TetR/AcrR family transcriptional regulator, cholesterol catabolism regulator
MEIEKKISRKEEIAREATRLFREKGYPATSMRDLAAELGIEAASLYSHIKSKEEILHKVCFRMAENFFLAINDIDQETDTTTEKLKKSIIAHVEVLTEDTNASIVFLNEWKHLSEPYLSDFIKMRDTYEHRFREIVLEGQRNGEFKYMDEKFAVLTLLSSLNWIPNWYKNYGKLDPTQIGQQLSSLVLSGLKNGI